MAYRIFSYDNNSKSANMLKEALGAMFLKHKGSTFKPEKGDVVFNWGSSADKPLPMLNSKVWACIDKLVFFKSMNTLQVGHHLPPFATNKADAKKLGFPVVCRTQLQGCDGAGIVLANNEDELVEAKLYTKYIPKDGEYRVHVGKNADGKYDVFLVQKKSKKSDSTNPDKKIRTTSNDYIFIHTGFVTPPSVIKTAIEVFSKTNMDFGGLDVIYTQSTGKAYVLEVNSAPELGKKACDAYVTFFSQFHTAAAEVAEGKPENEASGSQSNAANGTEEGIDVVAGLGDVVGTDVHKAPNSAGFGSPVGHDTTAPIKTAGTDISGGDIAGLMAQLENEFSKKVLHAYNEGFAKGKAQAPVVDVAAIKLTAYKEGKQDGLEALKAQMKAIFA